MILPENSAGPVDSCATAVERLCSPGSQDEPVATLNSTIAESCLDGIPPLIVIKRERLPGREFGMIILIRQDYSKLIFQTYFRKICLDHARGDADSFNPEVSFLLHGGRPIPEIFEMMEREKRKFFCSRHRDEIFAVFGFLGTRLCHDIAAKLGEMGRALKNLQHL